MEIFEHMIQGLMGSMGLMDMMSILQFLGWAVVGLVMILFALTGGFDFGAGILLPFLGRTDAERRVIINTVGPTWDGNQVWLITAGGAIFAIWPRVYAASFSGLYFAFLLVLWALFFRPVAFEYRSKIISQTWKSFWDWALFVGSFLPALLIGVAIGNFFLGLPFQYDPVTLRFFYGDKMADANALVGLFGLLRPFALFCGVVSVVMMVMQGSTYLALRTSGLIYDRARVSMKNSAWLLMLLFVIGGVWVFFLQGYSWTPGSDNALTHPLTNQVSMGQGFWLNNYRHYPALWIFPVLGFLGAFGVIASAKLEKSLVAFISSSIALTGVILTMGVALFPFIMPSSNFPAQSLLVWNASSSMRSLLGIEIVGIIMVPIILVYTLFVYKKLWGRGSRMSVERIEAESKNLY
jgi:cytochrome d ubiquinol oxidase subunit II